MRVERERDTQTEREIGRDSTPMPDVFHVPARDWGGERDRNRERERGVYLPVHTPPIHRARHHLLHLDIIPVN
jgi:hypothetical protein